MSIVIPMEFDELAEAQKTVTLLNKAIRIAYIWCILWNVFYYTVNIFITICTFFSTINNYSLYFTSPHLAIMNTIALVAKTLDLVIQSGQRATIAMVIKDNYEKISSMVESKIEDIKILTANGNKDQKTWKSIKSFLDTVSKMSDSWPTTGLTSISSFNSVKEQLSKSVSKEKVQSDQIDGQVNSAKEQFSKGVSKEKIQSDQNGSTVNSFIIS
jgi:hypothetical protein